VGRTIAERFTFSFGPKQGDYGFGVFNGKYRQQFGHLGMAFKFEGRNKGAGHLVVGNRAIDTAV